MGNTLCCGGKPAFHSNIPCLQTRLAPFLLNHQQRARTPPPHRRSLIPVPTNGIWISRTWKPDLVSYRLVEAPVMDLLLSFSMLLLPICGVTYGNMAKSPSYKISHFN